VASHEIWSIAFSPDNHYIATAGEDHTTHIYRIHDDNDNVAPTLEYITELKGKVMAVTALDWRTTAFGDLLVASSGIPYLRDVI